MKKIVVLDLGREEFRFAVAGIHRRQVTLLGSDSVPLTSDAKGASQTSIELGNRIREALKVYKVAKSPAIILIDRSEVEELNFALPPVPVVDLPQLVHNQVLLDLPGLTEDSVVDFVLGPVESVDERRNIIAFVLNPNSVESYKSICRQSGLQLTGIQYRPYASTVSARQSNDVDLGTVSLVITLYREEVELSVVAGNLIPLSRLVRLPGSIAAEESLARLLAEIHRTLLIAPQYLSAEHRIGEIRIQGPIEVVERLSKEVHEETGLPVLQVPPPDPQNVLLSEGVVLPLGNSPLLGSLLLAAKGEKPLIDFLNPRKGIEKTSHRRKLVLGAILLILGGYFGFDYLQMHYAKDDEELVGLRTNLNDLKKRLKEIDKDRKLAEALNDWESSHMNWLDELRELSVRIPPGREVTLSRLAFSPGRGSTGTIAFSASARTPDSVVNLEKSLRDERHSIHTPGIVRRTDKDYPWGFESAITVLHPVEKKEEGNASSSHSSAEPAKEGKKQR